MSPDYLELVPVNEGFKNSKDTGLNQSVYDEIYHRPKPTGGDRNITNEEAKPPAVSDKNTTSSDEPMTKKQYEELAYKVNSDGAINYDLKSALEKGFSDGRTDLKKLNEELDRYGLHLDLNPLETGLQLNLSKDGKLIDSEISRSPEAKRASVELRYKDKMDDPDVKKFVEQYKDAFQRKVVSPEMLNSLQNLGKKAWGDDNLQKMMSELGKVDGVDFKFEKDSVTVSRNWKNGSGDPSHGGVRVEIKTALDGSCAQATRHDSSPYPIGSDKKREISLAEAAKSLVSPLRAGERFKLPEQIFRR